MGRKDNLESIGDVLKSVVRKYSLEKGLEDARVKELWAEFLGEEIRVHTQWMRIKDDVLYARMAHSTVRHEVFNCRAALKAFINDSLGQERIRDIRLV